MMQSKKSVAYHFSDDVLQALYSWVDEIPLTRPKKNIARDFSDGVLMAQIVNHFFPSRVELHNYSGANSVAQKKYNWQTLNQKVFKRKPFHPVSLQDIDMIIKCVPGAIEKVLLDIQRTIAMHSTDLSPEIHKAPSGHLSQSDSQPQPLFSSQRGTPGRSTFEGMGDSMPMSSAVPPSVLEERERRIRSLEESNHLLEVKVRKLEQLVQLKDARIEALQAKLHSVGVL
ncbi:hypothetical protein ADUPG1_008277 [Aduncisulcus paluster]|uniref:Calponin-homology (CH) domain-containing protein n=1 Tax=Aduncisulcus paluster TaxID=2918883 RepID=A0ABQ5KRD0_9EUKA|nr:hypothetical protein ADUPG1_008277 [Aduncisulcus paluster]